MPILSDASLGLSSASLRAFFASDADFELSGTEINETVFLLDSDLIDWTAKILHFDLASFHFY